VSYQEFGGNYFDEQDRQAVTKRLLRRWENLGYHVSLEAAAQIAWAIASTGLFSEEPSMSWQLATTHEKG
jgi:hypothetical protein